MFEVHLLNEDGIAKAKKIQDLFVEFAAELELLTGDRSREKSIMLTKLEESSFYAKRAMAMLTENNK
jgi:hypothetical protein